MRKVLSILLALSLGLTLAYCGDNGDDDPCPDLDCCTGKACTGDQVCNASGVCEDPPSCPNNEECCAAVPCTDPQVCNDDGVCEDPPECCEGQEKYAYVAGTVVEFGANTPVSVDLALVGATNALTSDNPTHLTETTSDAQGAYETECVDLDGQSIGMLMLADDTDFDGTAGTYYPTYSGVMAISSAADLTCEPEAPTAFAFPNTLIGLLSQIPGLETLSTDGFALILILDAQMQPVAGAQLLHKDGTALPVTIYPDMANQDFTGTETSSDGLAIVAGLTSLTPVMPVKTGMTWVDDLIGIVPGYCFTRPLLADE